MRLADHGQQELMGTIWRRPSRSRRRGQALVEFALVIPIFLFLLMAVVDLGRGVFAYNSVTNAAREGTRLAIVNQTTALIQQRALDQGALAGTPVVSVAFRKTTPNADFATNPGCNVYSSNTRPMNLDCVAIVTFATTFQPITPFVSNLVFPSGVTLRATSIQNVEYVCPNVNVPAAANCRKQP